MAAAKVLERNVAEHIPKKCLTDILMIGGEQNQNIGLRPAKGEANEVKPRGDFSRRKLSLLLAWVTEQS